MPKEAIIEADAKEVADKILSAARDASSEADLEVNTEHILKTVLDKLGIANYASYEFRTGKGTLVEGTGKIDALYGRVVIEYESPGAFEHAAGFNHAKEQVIEYIEELTSSVEAWQRYFGVVLDGYQIGFVRFRKNWVSDGPYLVNERTILTFLEALRGLRRLALRVESLNKYLGAGSPLAETLVEVLYETLIKSKEHRRVKVLFNDWKRVFGQVCGYSAEKMNGLEKAYGLSEDNIDYEGLLFAVHTYYALVMKLLAAEVAVSLGGIYLQSYLKKFEEAYYHGHEELKNMLRDIEEGDIFSSAIGIKNFLEGDYFGWYLDVWDEQLREAVSKLAKTLSEFEPATLEHEPEEVKDLLKRLYQYLVPKKIRHDLGEYYTPDWLAELIISEVGYDGNLDKRFLDPACGSGTFLVLAIKRARQYALDHFKDETETLESILKNIVGFDLNPLAVLAARTNYLIALGKFIKYKRGEIEIPVYFTDSILVERKQTLYGSYAYSLKTEAGEFQIPIGVVKKGLLPRVLAVVEDCVKSGFSVEEFEERLKREVLRSGARLNRDEIYILNGFFQKIADLEKDGRNRIWTRILKNSFAPLLLDKFDFVVGNPPWVNWESLPENYRNGTKGMWEDYKLFTLSGKEARSGGGEKDISILFTYRCLDRYLKEGGNFAFLITQSVFKTKGAGEGFRRFKIKDEPLEVLKVHDLVEMKPFEGASNRTAAIFLKKKGETSYPVKYELWRRKPGERIDQRDSLEEALRKSSRIELDAYPSDEKNKLSPWLTLPEKAFNAVNKIKGKGYYRAYGGVHNIGANAVYWLNILGVASRRREKIDIPAYLQYILGIRGEEIEIKEIVVENITEGMKKDVRKVRTAIEDFFVFPLIKTQHLKRWKLSGYIYTLQMQDPKKRIGYDERWVKINFPKTYGYLKGFEEVIKERNSKIIKQLMEKGPFYSIYGVGEYTFSPYKVVWNQMGSRLTACVISSVNDEFLGEKLILPEHVLAFVPINNENETHFICAVLNSSVVDLTIRSIAGGTKSFGTPKIIEETIRIPRFDANNEVHRKLAELSKKAHELAAKGEEDRLREVEEEIESEVARLFGLNEDEVGDVKEVLRVVYGEGEVVEGEEVEELKREERARGRALEGLIKRFKEDG
jgi:SAM-dependent methyltransferase